MTGFGRVSGQVGNRRVTVEVKSLNSKSLDLNLRLPVFFKQKEIEFRQLVAEKVYRGKVELYVNIEEAESNQQVVLNESKISTYFSELRGIGEKAGAVNTDYFALALKMPDVMDTEEAEVTDSEWNQLRDLILGALSALGDFRKQEGAELEKDFALRVSNIESLLEQIMALDPVRIDKMKSRIEKKLEDLELSEQLDENRLEQEMVYYIEKLDITEEYQRLKAHCSYFKDTMNQQDANGKKLGFIAQEFGREINTIGSKANDADIQRLVVQMKDELEKIKEQIMNII